MRTSTQRPLAEGRAKDALLTLAVAPGVAASQSTPVLVLGRTKLLIIGLRAAQRWSVNHVDDRSVAGATE